MQLSELARIVNGRLQGHDKVWEGSVEIDTRKLQPGQLFLALQGENFDAHDFISQAAEAGAVAALVHRSVASSIPLIHVQDTVKALADIADYHQAQFPCRRITVTGSCGKTTSKMLLSSVFSKAGKVLSSPASFNNAIGVPLTLLQLTADIEYAIFEIGANHLSEVGILSRLVQPDVAIITMAGYAHLEGFGDLQGVAKTKGEIFQGLTMNGTAVINADDGKASYWRQLAAAHQIITFGIEQSADIMAENITMDAKGYPCFTLCTPIGQSQIRLPLLGLHNIYNALVAAAAAYVFNLDLEKICEGLEQAQAVGKRLVEYLGVAGSTIIDDSYNANPTSMLAAIKLLTQRSSQTILVMADMLELGPSSDELHRQMGVQAKQHGVNQLFCLGKYSQLAAEAFGKEAFAFSTHEALIEALRPRLNDQVTVLVKGSRGMVMERVVVALKQSEF